jgi:pimeloyl-ACP methyl ester carboxylesterase
MTAGKGREENMLPARQANCHHRQVNLGRVRLHCVEAGAGPLVLLLHGFPEFWYSWRHQLPALAAAGYHAVAPDLPGYNLSSKPRGVRSYRVEALVEDLVGLIRAFGQEKAFVAGHDWGGVLAWHLAAYHPRCVRRLAILNAPHPAAYFRELGSTDQLLKSWYVFFFQLPLLPELFLRRRNLAFLDEKLRREPSRPAAFTDSDVGLYKEALRRPGALTAALNYYRAALRRGWRRDPRLEQPLRLPSVVIWGERDAYLSPRLLDGLDRWVPEVRIERLPGISHWVQNDAPEQVNRLLLEFLA